MYYRIKYLTRSYYPYSCVEDSTYHDQEADSGTYLYYVLFNILKKISHLDCYYILNIRTFLHISNCFNGYFSKVFMRDTERKYSI